MGAAARDYVRREHELERVADLYEAACDEYTGDPIVETEVFNETARAAQEVGLDIGDPAVGELAQRMREAGIVR
jgi:hypothetical protein